MAAFVDDIFFNQNIFIKNFTAPHDPLFTVSRQ